MKTTRLLILIVMMGFVVKSFGIPPNLIYVYKYGPAAYSMDDFERTPWALAGFVGALHNKERNDRPDLISIFLYSQLDESARQALSKYAASELKIKDVYSGSGLQELKTIAKETDIEAILVTNLNRIIRGPSIYEKERFRDVELNPQTKSLLKQNPQGDDLIRLNWLLLGDAYTSPLWAGAAPSRNAIEAYGGITGIFKRKEHISNITIFPKKLSEAELQDIWVEFSPTNRIAMADITEDRIKPDSDNLYYFYQFEDRKLVGFKVAAYDHDYPNYKEEKTVRVGSIKNKSSLKLPCSLEDFEKVFGKADEVDRKFMW